MPRLRNVVPIEEWPAQHRAGLEHALHALRRHNRRRKRFKWGPDMCRGVCTSYGRWLFWARQQPWYDLSLPVDSLLTPERVEAFVVHLEDCRNRPATLRHRMMGLERMMAAVAPDVDRDWLKEIKSRFAKTGDRRAKRARLQYTDVLIKFAAELAEQAEALAVVDDERGRTLLRTAAQIMMLAYRAMRLKNFRQLRLGIEVVEEEDGRWKLDIPAEATKRGNEYDPYLPKRVVDLTLRYLALCSKPLGQAYADHDALWLFTNGRQQSARSINYHITEQTKKKFDRSMSPHLFRDAVVTTVADQMPEHVRMSPLLIGNRDQGCVEDHYNQAQRVIADRKYNSTLDDLEDGV